MLKASAKTVAAVWPICGLDGHIIGYFIHLQTFANP